MSVRKRIGKARAGRPKEAWVVDYVDQHGDRHLKTFAKKREADAHHAMVGVEVRAGTHTADSKSITVAKAAELWLEAATPPAWNARPMAAYRQHAELHIVPVLGRTAAVAAHGAVVAASRTGCAGTGGRRRWCARPAARSAPSWPTPGARPGGAERGASLRRQRRSAARGENGKLKIGVDIPSPTEIRAIIGKLAPQRPLAAAAAHRDLHRAACLRAARPALERCGPQARRAPCAPARRPLRHDRAAEVGSGRAHGAAAADGGHRVARAPAGLPEKRQDLVFANSQRQHRAPQHDRRARLSSGTGRGRHRRSARRAVAKYKGLHALRHFYASWCINRRVDGGLELPLKVVQARLGHASIQMTADIYGHLFPRGDDGPSWRRPKKCSWDDEPRAAAFAFQPARSDYLDIALV